MVSSKTFDDRKNDTVLPNKEDTDKAKALVKGKTAHTVKPPKLKHTSSSHKLGKKHGVQAKMTHVGEDADSNAEPPEKSSTIDKPHLIQDSQGLPNKSPLEPIQEPTTWAEVKEAQQSNYYVNDLYSSDQPLNLVTGIDKIGDNLSNYIQVLEDPLAIEILETRQDTEVRGSSSRQSTQIHASKIPNVNASRGYTQTHPPSLNFNFEEFDPHLYLRNVHYNTSVKELQIGKRNLELKVASHQRQLEFLVNDNFSHFMVCKDLIHQIGAEIDSRKQTMSSEMITHAEFTFHSITRRCKEIFTPLIERENEIEFIRNTLSILKPSQFIFKLPQNIRDNIKSGDYDKVVVNYKKLKSLVGIYSPSSIKNMIVSVESTINDLRTTLFELLASHNQTLKDQEKIISQLIDLDSPVDPLWTCILMRYRTIKNILFKISKSSSLRQSSHCPSECKTNEANPEIHRASSVMEEHLPDFFYLCKKFLNHHYQHDRDDVAGDQTRGFLALRREKDEQLKPLLEQIHNLYQAIVLKSFYGVFSSIQSVAQRPIRKMFSISLQNSRSETSQIHDDSAANSADYNRTSHSLFRKNTRRLSEMPNKNSANVVSNLTHLSPDKDNHQYLAKKHDLTKFNRVLTHQVSTSLRESKIPLVNEDSLSINHQNQPEVESLPQQTCVPSHLTPSLTVKEIDPADATSNPVIVTDNTGDRKTVLIIYNLYQHLINLKPIGPFLTVLNNLVTVTTRTFVFEVVNSIEQQYKNLSTMESWEIVDQEFMITAFPLKFEALLQKLLSDIETLVSSQDCLIIYVHKVLIKFINNFLHSISELANQLHQNDSTYNNMNVSHSQALTDSHQLPLNSNSCSNSPVPCRDILAIMHINIPNIHDRNDGFNLLTHQVPMMSKDNIHDPFLVLPTKSSSDCLPSLKSSLSHDERLLILQNICSYTKCKLLPGIQELFKTKYDRDLIYHDVFDGLQGNKLFDKLEDSITSKYIDHKVTALKNIISQGLIGSGFIGWANYSTFPIVIRYYIFNILLQFVFFHDELYRISSIGSEKILLLLSRLMEDVYEYILICLQPIQVISTMAALQVGMEFNFLKSVYKLPQTPRSSELLEKLDQKLQYLALMDSKSNQISQDQRQVVENIISSTAKDVRLITECLAATY